MPCGPYGQELEWHCRAEDNTIQQHQSSWVWGDWLKVGCGRMHLPVAAGHSQKLRIFVDFASELQRRYTKLCTGTDVVCGWRRPTHRTKRRPTTRSLPRNRLRPCLLRQGVLHLASGCGSPKIATHFVLASSGCATPFVSAAALPEHCCAESGSHYLLFLEEDCDTMLESVDACGVGLSKKSEDAVHSTN